MIDDQQSKPGWAFWLTMAMTPVAIVMLYFALYLSMVHYQTVLFSPDGTQRIWMRSVPSYHRWGGGEVTHRSAWETFFAPAHRLDLLVRERKRMERTLDAGEGVIRIWDIEGIPAQSTAK